MKMLVLMMAAGFTFIYCILQLFTHPVSNRNFATAPAFDTRSQLLDIPDTDPGSENGRKPSATTDQCSPRNQPPNEEVGAKSLERRLPKCLIIGFGKCGTYALKSFLTLHPDIVGPNHEIRFFSSYYHRGLDWYREQMPVSLESQITIEKTPNYIVSPEALSRIRKFNDSIKLIVIVRDPLVRLQSMYAHAQAKSKRFNKTFESWVNIKGNIAYTADYAKHIKEVFRLFDANQVLLVEGEELEKSPLTLLRNVERFLGLCHAFTDDLLVFNRDKGFYCFNQSSWRYPEMEETLSLDRWTGCFPASKGREHPEIERRLMRQLLVKLNPYNEKLFALLGKRFNWTRPGRL
ncbi:hypothetical protein BsWGS_10612 [Bradybaena similaris]